MRADRTIELIRQGYRWAPRLRNGAAAVPNRLLGRRAAVVGGPAEIRRFYDPRLSRRRAFPMPIQLVLFGPGTVHSLDDAEHHHRLVEQRGGVATGHRCPGEAVTLTMLAVAARVLARRPARFLPRTWATISPVSPPARTAA